MIYVPTGQDDVFAVNVDTGEILWEYKAHLDQTISRRLLRLGEPRRRARRRQGLHRAARRQARRARPEDRPGRLEDAGRALAGRLLDHRGAALRRRHGDHRRLGRRVRHRAAASPPTTRRPASSAWRFYTIPGPGETGHDTWPQTGDAWKARRRAGLADAVGRSRSSGSLYFTTGNAGPDNNGSAARRQQPLHRVDGRARREDRQAASGATRWCTTTSGTTTRRARRCSSTRRSTARSCTGSARPRRPAGSTCSTARPASRCSRRRRSRCRRTRNQKTWPTQPIPPYAPVVPHVPSHAQYSAVLQAREGRCRTARR